MSPFKHVGSNLLTGVSRGAVVSKRNSHWLVAYERIIGAYRGTPERPHVPVMQLSPQGSQPFQDFWNHQMSAYLNKPIRYSQSKHKHTLHCSPFQEIKDAFIISWCIFLKRFPTGSIVLRTSFRQSFIVPTHIGMQRGDVTAVNQFRCFLLCIVEFTENFTIERRITIPMAIDRKNRIVTELDTDARASSHDKRKCVRGGDQFVDPTYCCASQCVVSGLPLTSLIYKKKWERGQPPVPLVKVSHCCSKCFHTRYFL